MPNKLSINQQSLAYNRQAGNSFTVIFCPGFNSSMQGAKALAFEAHCKQLNLESIRFDYRGTGQSSGDFAEASISAWLQDTLSIIDELATHSVILIGSSMGAWLALRAALERPNKVQGLLLIACAADMTSYYSSKLADLSKKRDRQGRAIKRDRQGRAYYELGNDFDGGQPYRLYQRLLDDGQQHCLLNHEIKLDIPVSLIHGKQDDVVPWQRSQEIIKQLQSPRINYRWINDGDHRLSRPQDLRHLTLMLDALLATINDN